MEQMTMQEIAQAVGCAGKYPGTITAVSTDSREITRGCLFIALKGERFNAHNYIIAALQAGAGWALAHERRDYGFFTDRVLYVVNTERALMDIARAYRAKFNIRCAGVTGSVGKTTTKDMIAAVLASSFKTLKTQDNLNNEIGLSKTLLQLTEKHEAAVLEMGMQGRGEIAALAALARPQLGVITNIGVSHIEQLGSRENILAAKLELAGALPDGATLLLCGDDPMLAQVKLPRLNVRLYGIENTACRVRGGNIREALEKTTFTIYCGGERFEAMIPCVGQHNVLNALAAFAAGRVFGIPSERCAAALANYVPSGMRQKIVKYRGYTVVEDCYNASPDSVRAALQTLASYPCTGKRVAVLADMLELGDIAEREHIEIGSFAAEQKIDVLLTYGERAQLYCEGARGGVFKPQTAHFSSKDALLNVLRLTLSAGDVVWVKGSHGMHLETVLQGLYSEETSER